MSDHGTASTSGLYVEFQSAVLRQLPRQEVFTDEILKGWIDNQEALKNVLAEALLPPAAPDIEGILSDWSNFYFDLWGQRFDFSGIQIPKRQAGFDRLLVLAQGLTTPQRLFNKCKEMFRVWKYTERDLDEFVQSDRASQNGHYAVLVRDRVEADKENANLSANDCQKKGIIGETLEEREVHELKVFKETGKHLDIRNWTLCTGSRASDGSVPCAYWHVDEFRVFWSYPGNRHDDLCSRSAVS